MESNVQPSFIPKKPVTQAGVKTQRNTSLFSLIATVIFITVLVLAGIVYGVEYFLNKTIEKKKVTLQTELNKFEPALVKELSRLDTRLVIANDILANHVSFTGLFKALNNVTLKTVRFTSFTLLADGQKNTLTMKGEAQSFTAAALQSDEFNKQENAKIFKGAVLDNPNLDGKGNVTFNVSSGIDPKQVSYSTVYMPQGGVTLSSTPVTATISTTTAKTATSSNARSKTNR